MLKILETHFANLSTRQIDQFYELENLYKEWNQKINLISRKDTDYLIEKHILHALFITQFFNFEDSTQVIDIGTGGGIPGIPLAIFYPNVSFTLVDSIGKKISVVKEISKRLQLKNVFPIWDRIENIRKANFDISVSRATAPLKSLVEWSSLCLNPKSKIKNTGLICLKGGELSAEIQEAKVQAQIFSIEKKTLLPYYENKYILYIPSNQLF